jgi:hypothetical protein
VGSKIGIVGTVCYAILVFVYVSVAAPLPAGVPFALGPETTVTDPHLITFCQLLAASKPWNGKSNCFGVSARDEF